ncbi:hypothetical protein MPLA_1870011 [Mesorhizobium sp. ORS 3359]|nr:hypothetical protein MPLA_1870011 [Mesorhizobium sp. ORS 3359]
MRWSDAPPDSGGRGSKHRKVCARPPSLPYRASPPQGGRLYLMYAFANRQRCREMAVAEAANLPP